MTLGPGRRLPRARDRKGSVAGGHLETQRAGGPGRPRYHIMLVCHDGNDCRGVSRRSGDDHPSLNVSAGAVKGSRLPLVHGGPGHPRSVVRCTRPLSARHLWSHRRWRHPTPSRSHPHPRRPWEAHPTPLDGRASGPSDHPTPSTACLEPRTPRLHDPAPLPEGDHPTPHSTVQHRKTLGYDHPTPHERYRGVSGTTQRPPPAARRASCPSRATPRAPVPPSPPPSSFVSGRGPDPPGSHHSGHPSHPWATAAPTRALGRGRRPTRTRSGVAVAPVSVQWC